MAERDKSHMDAEVQQALKGYKIRWQTREGAPFSAADLAKVSASAASTVILMRPDNSRVQFKDSDSAAVRRQRLHQVTPVFSLWHISLSWHLPSPVFSLWHMLFHCG